MAFNQHTLPSIDIHALSGFNIDDLKGTKTFHLHILIPLQGLTDGLEHHVDKECSLFLGQTVLNGQLIGNFLNRNLSHHSSPPFLICSFQFTLGLKFNTNLGGTSIR